MRSLSAASAAVPYETRAVEDTDVPYLTAPGVLLFADEPRRREALSASIAQVGGRVVASGPLSAALDRIGAHASGGVAKLAVEIATDDGNALDAILDRLNALAAEGRIAALILTPVALLDIVTARLDGRGIAVLVDPGSAECDAALADLIAPATGRVTEEGESENRRKLVQLSEEVGRIARALAALSDDAAPASAEPAVTSLVPDAPLVRAILRMRRLRGLHFEPALFADPAWDILLDLAAARIEGRPVAVSSLCIAAAVPATTALRWIAQMTEQALLVRQPDARDGRRVFIGLSNAAAAAMNAYLIAARRIVAPAG